MARFVGWLVGGLVGGLTPSAAARSILIAVSPRFALQPREVQFLVLTVLSGATWAVLFTLASPPDHVWSDVWSTAITALCLGVAVSAWLLYSNRGRRRSMAAAVAGLSAAERSAAIAAVTAGVVPQNPAVRASAARLGTAYLGDRRPDRVRRDRRRAVLTGVVLGATGVVATLLGYVKVSPGFYVAIVVLVAIGAQLAVVHRRRVQNILALQSADRAA